MNTETTEHAVSTSAVAEQEIGARKDLSGRRKFLFARTKLSALRTRCVGILVFISFPFVTTLFRAILPPWVFMWLLAFSLFIGCKCLTWSRLHARPDWRRAFGYLFLWPGMDPRVFRARECRNGTTKENPCPALLITTTGFILLILAGSLSLYFAHLWVGWLGMLGIILFLHFGMFELLTTWWRRNGVEAKSVMNHPLRAASLSEFWGERWNTAFNALAIEFLFSPLTRHFRMGKKASLRRAALPLVTMIVFAASGLVHELVISFPARGGYGLPTAYFLLQGCAVLFERSRTGRKLGLGHGWVGWLFMAICTAGPAFWLFHPAFVRNVILPMLQTLALNGNAYL